MYPADLPPDGPELAASEATRDRAYAWDDPAPSAAAARDLYRLLCARRAGCQLQG